MYYTFGTKKCTYKVVLLCKDSSKEHVSIIYIGRVTFLMKQSNEQFCKYTFHYEELQGGLKQQKRVGVQRILRKQKQDLDGEFFSYV